MDPENKRIILRTIFLVVILGSLGLLVQKHYGKDIELFFYIIMSFTVFTIYIWKTPKK